MVTLNSCSLLRIAYLFPFNVDFQSSQCSEVFLYDPTWVPEWNWYHLLLLLIIPVLLAFDSFISGLILTGAASRIYIRPKILHWLLCPSDAFNICLVDPYSNHSKPFYQKISPQCSWHGVEYGVCLIYMLVDHHGGWYFLHTGIWYIHFYSGPP